MKEFIVILISVITFLVIFEGVLPKGKFGKIVKTIMSLIVVLTMLVPIIKIFNSGYDLSKVLNSDANYEKYLEEYKKTTLVKEITAVLYSEDIEVKSVFVELSEEKNKVTILLKNEVLNENNEHIDILEKAKTLVVERFYLSAWEVIVE